MLAGLLTVSALIFVPLPSSIPIVGNNTNEASAHSKTRTECTNEPRSRLVTKYKYETRYRTVWKWNRSIRQWIRSQESSRVSVPYTERFYYTERVCRNVSVPHSHPSISETINAGVICTLAGVTTKSVTVGVGCFVSVVPKPTL